MRSSDAVQSEEEEEEEMEGEEEEEEGSEDNDRGDEQRDEEESEESDCDDDRRDKGEGEEEASLVEDQVGFNHVEGESGGKLLVQNSSSLQEEANERDCAVVVVGGKRWPSTFVWLGNMGTFSRRLELISLVSFVELLEDISLPKATPEEFASVYSGLAVLGSYQLEVDWRIEQMAFLLELLDWRDRLEKVSNELEEVEATAARLRKRKKKLEGEVAERESASSGGFDMTSHAGQGLRR
ncbi:hypothetical protein RHMOL_Rhmol04G0246100 [Rhododendron molle]|uniref:Uncharacterized protein n=1 Tax=Rhododendron molle TaxID=49168 RepID=A0ACC0P456_RHOML|nr:hypothetical protein RHMOL_Rhmol04G0246100 [Rhododendron molle]